ncbi:MAG TPA: MOSC domain-containing protein [Candidatus Saccharimonadales bacterium]|nr:MOSC domain-containing protein [Candidatus Saccharimonadales bacterium]
MKRTLVAKGTVESVLMTPHNQATSEQQTVLPVSHAYGLSGDRHSGGYVVSGHDDDLLSLGFTKGTPAANLRQFSMVSTEELAAIAEEMQLPGSVMPPGLLGENIVVSGIADLTSTLKAGSLLCFTRRNTDMPQAALLVTGPNEPCGHPHANIVAHFGGPAEFKARMPFLKAAAGRRGVVGLVRVGGGIEPGDTMQVWAVA